MKSVLLVEDNEPFRTLLKMILSANYEVHACGDGYSAVAVLRSERVPDLVITDLNLPGLSGFELLHFVKRSGLLCDIPVVILSGQKDKETIEHCLSAGAAKFLSKPFDPGSLLDELKGIVPESNLPLENNRESHQLKSSAWNLVQ